MSSTHLRSDISNIDLHESRSTPLLLTKGSTRFSITGSKKHESPRSIVKSDSDDIPPEQLIHVCFRGQNVTPERLTTRKYASSEKKYDLDDAIRKPGKSSQVTRFSAVGKANPVSVKRRISHLSLTNLTEDKNLSNFTDTEEYDDFDEDIPSAMCLPAVSSKIVYPEKMKIILEETDDITLFELPSKTVTKGTREAEAVEKANEIYEYLTVGKGKNRKKISTEAQTTELILKTRHTNASRTERKNSHAFASVWDMFDSYQQDSGGDKKLLPDTEELVALNKLFVSETTTEKNEKESDSDEVKGIKNTENLLNAVCIMERVLASNNFREQQENYKGLLRYESGPLLVDSYNYILKPLWTFQYYKIGRRPASSLVVNTKNTDIIGVGYGKVNYIHHVTGAICIWNIKNPTQPERFYEFPIPVTIMAFSKSNPNLLAVGFYNGNVSIVDISSHKLVELAKSSRKDSPSYLPVWEIQWFFDKDLNSGAEQVLVINIDGRIDTFAQTKTKDFICFPTLKLMHTDRMTWTMAEKRECDCSEEIPLFKTEKCRTICWHPTKDDIYFIGTNGGCIYKCSTNYFSTYLDKFIAHRGSINGMEFSKFCLDIFVTCGNDWTVKIWNENVFVPLIVLITDMLPVTFVQFSPTHSTIIVAIAGSHIYLWNIQHKTDSASLHLNLAPKFGALTDFKFTENGKNIIIADKHGKIHMRYLLGLFPPQGNQSQILKQAIQNNLIVQPDLMSQINKKEKMKRYL